MRRLCYSGGYYNDPGAVGSSEPPRTWSVYTPLWAPACFVNSKSQKQCTPIRCGNQMRRKAETLRHLNNSAHLTKKQQFSYAMQQGMVVDSSRCGSNTVCKSYDRQLASCFGALPPRYSSYPPYYSNVPGRLPLVYDKSVGLTNYVRVTHYPTATQVAARSLPNVDSKDFVNNPFESSPTHGDSG